MQTHKKVLKTPLRISLVALLLGMVMRMLDWPYAAGVLFTSFLAVGILYAVRFSKKENKQPVAYIKMILVLFWTTNGLLRILDFPHTLFFQIGTALTFVTWFAMEGTAYFMDEDRKAKNSMIEIIWNFAMVIGVLTIISGGLMHLIEWEYSTTTLTIGLTIVTAYILKDVFSPVKEIEKDPQNQEIQV
jgi:membrane protein implicated in regulation of membrane protease activity